MTVTSKIVDNDMGAVLKVPPTGVGTIYGIDVTVNGITLPQYDCNIVEMTQPGMGVSRFEDFVYDNLDDSDSATKEAFVNEFKKFATSRRNSIIKGY